jgi:5-formyltetrahydrofolate cyclo-ligase
MDEIQKTKTDIRKEIAAAIGALSANERTQKNRDIEHRLFNFANFLEARIVLMYIENQTEVASAEIIRRTFALNKLVVLPLVKTDTRKFTLFKIDDFEKDMKRGANGVLQPDQEKCRTVPVDCIDIAIIPGLAFDEKGGRIGPGDGYYDRLIPHLPITTRKVALALECQIIPQVPIESHDKYVDIIITEKRIIYKI